MPLAYTCEMSRAVVSLACALIVLLVLHGVSEAPIARTQPASVDPPEIVEPPRTPPSVRIEHEIVRVPSRALPRPRPRPTSAVRQAQAAPNPAPLRVASRTRRVLFGDGTYRPEPFPRPSRD